MLAAAQRVPQTHADLTVGTWRGDYYSYDQVGPELGGSTVGVVGYGSIEPQVAVLLRGSGARVLVHDPYLDPAADDHVELTPHLAGDSRPTAANATRLTAAELGRWVRGESPAHPASPT